MAPTNDRTAEFFAIADARCKQRGRAPATRQRAAKTPFGETAQRLGRALHATEARTSRLQKLACKSSLFDDPAAEINEINLAVRRELSGAATGLDALGSAKRPGSNQFAAHADALLAWLRARMAAVTSDFQAALKQREATISAKESRAAQLGVASVASPFATPFAAPAAPKAFGSSCGGAGSSSSISGGGGPSGGRLAKPQLLPVGGVRRRPTAGTGAAAVAVASERAYHDLEGFGGSGGGGGGAYGAEPSTSEQLQAQQFWTPRSQKHRQQEVTQMQSTLAELGSMFQRFGAIVSEQGALVDRIDQNTDISLDNVEDAHKQIMKYQRTITGNRGLMLKIFGVLFFFIVIFGTMRR